MIWIILITIGSICTAFALDGLFKVVKKKIPKNKKERLYKVVVNGQRIALTSNEYTTYIDNLKKERFKKEQIKQEEIKKDKEIFDSSVVMLRDCINDDIIKCNDPVKKKVLEALLNCKINNETDFDKVFFLYNSGNLRTAEEVELYNTEIRNTVKRGSYNTDRHIINFVCFIIPFLITFFAVYFSVEDFRILKFIGIPLSLMPAIFVGVIGLAIGNTINIGRANNIEIPLDDPMVKSERIKRGTAIAGTIASTVGTIHNIKSAAKDIGNPDGWKEMK